MSPAVIIVVLVGVIVVYSLLRSEKPCAQERKPCAQKPPPDSDQPILVYRGTPFRKGDRVRVKSCGGPRKRIDTGHTVDVIALGQVGTVLRLYRPDRDGELLIRWDAQEWEEYDTRKRVSLQTFDDNIHANYLVDDGDGDPNMWFDYPIAWERRYVALSERRPLTRTEARKRSCVIMGLPQEAKDYLHKMDSGEIIRRIAHEFTPTREEEVAGVLAYIGGDAVFGFLNPADMPAAIEADCQLPREIALRIAIRLTRHLIVPMSRFSCFQFGNVEAYIEDWKDELSGV